MVEPDYPRDMYVWKGVPYHIDSVLKWKDGNAYFFQGKVFWKFNDKYMKVEDETPTLSAPFWMGCTSNPVPPLDGDSSTPSKATSITIFHYCIVFALALQFVANLLS